MIEHAIRDIVHASLDEVCIAGEGDCVAGGQIVEYDNVIAGIDEEPCDNRTDESCAAGYQPSHQLSHSIAPRWESRLTVSMTASHTTPHNPTLWVRQAVTRRTPIVVGLALVKAIPAVQTDWLVLIGFVCMRWNLPVSWSLHPRIVRGTPHRPCS